MRSTNYIKGLIMLIASFTVFLSKAQDAVAPVTPPPAAPSSPSNYSLYLLLGTAIILLFIIAVLGQVLIRLTLYVYENKSKVVKSVLLLLMLGIGSHSAFAQAAAAAAPVAAQAASRSGGFSMDLMVGLSVILIEAFVIFMLLVRIFALLNVINPRPQAARKLNFEMPRWFDRFNDSVAVEKEKDILLDHDYDGIKELDNQLPPWWKWGFVATIIIAIVYFSYYHVFHAGPLSAEEYTNSVAEAKVAKDAYMKTAKSVVDENTIVFDASYVNDGQKLFTANCAPCHGPKGEGIVGPNLTDNYWLHGGKINDIFKSIKYGWPANGMKSWQGDFSATQIAQLTCYVKSLKGTNPPNGKEPQGDLYTEDGAANDANMKTAKSNIDENTVVFDASYLGEGQKIFTANCAPCHGQKGEGIVGPNLTDNYWLHGGKINDIFKTIKYGSPEKGMKSWQADLSAIQIAQVSSYIKSLKGTNPPNGKEPQGNLYTEDGAAKGAATSTTGK